MKTEVVRVRLTEFEKQKLIDHAKSMSMSLSDYIKFCCLIELPAIVKKHNQ
ncbi:MAG: hypothetical protein IBX70_10515 [Clostridia bacterium]|nr:hypothetical protein [Clostridia bacterium]